MAFTLHVTEENRNRLASIKSHFGLQSLAAAVWFAVAEVWRRIAARKEGEK